MRGEERLGAGRDGRRSVMVMEMAGDGGDGGDDSDVGRLLSRFSITACPLCLLGSRVPMAGETQPTGFAPKPQPAGTTLRRPGQRHPCPSPATPQPSAPRDHSVVAPLHCPRPPGGHCRGPDHHTPARAPGAVRGARVTWGPASAARIAPTRARSARPRITYACTGPCRPSASRQRIHGRCAACCSRRYLST